MTVSAYFFPVELILLRLTPRQPLEYNEGRQLSRQCLYRFITGEFYEVEDDDWVDGLASFAKSEMKMRGCGSPGVAGDGDGFSRGDDLFLPDKRPGQVAVADGVVAVADGDIVAAAPVVADLYDLAGHHGVSFGVVGAEVKAVVAGFLAGERILAGAIGRGDINGL